MLSNLGTEGMAVSQWMAGALSVAPNLSTAVTTVVDLELSDLESYRRQLTAYHSRAAIPSMAARPYG